MVKIIGFHLAKRGTDGKEFIALELESDIELVQSMDTGKFYATARRCSITSTFSEETAKGLIGQKLPGTIKRVESLPYDYTVEETGEVIKLGHTYEFTPEEAAEIAPSYNPLSERTFSLKRSLITS